MLEVAHVESGARHHHPRHGALEVPLRRSRGMRGARRPGRVRGSLPSATAHPLRMRY